MVEKLKKDDHKRIKRTGDGGAEIESENSSFQDFLKAITSDKAKLGLVVVVALIYLIISFNYMHKGVIIVFAAAVPIAYMLFKKMKKRDYVTILEKPAGKSPKLFYANPNYYGSLEHKDEPATLEESNTEIIEEDDEKKLALKGIQTTRKGGTLIVCQDFNPEEGYIHHGWVDGMTVYDYIMERAKFEQLTSFANALKRKYNEELVLGQNIAMEQEEEFIERLSNLPEDKPDPRENIDNYEEKKKVLGLEDGDTNQ